MIATFIALSGTAYAAIKLPANSVGSAQIKTGAVNLTDINNKSEASLREATGAQGPQGPQGARGLPGPPGAPGAACPASDPACRGPKGDSATAQPSPAATAVTPAVLGHGEYCADGTDNRRGEFCNEGNGAIFYHWTNYGSGYAPGSFYKDSGGTVHLVGTVEYVLDGPQPIHNQDACGITGRNAIFYLPPEMSPGVSHAFATTSGASAPTQVEVAPDGGVRCVRRTGGAVLLDGIDFQAGH